MGDNGKRARAWPRKEGQCDSCERWLILRKDGRIPRHACRGSMTGGALPADTHPKETT